MRPQFASRVLCFMRADDIRPYTFTVSNGARPILCR